jgi:hypothetical protein
MKRFVLGFLCALSLSIAPACGGDDDSSSGADAAGGGVDVAAFCTQFGTVCGFTADWYTDQAGCVATVTAWGADRQACVVEHLGFADDADDGSADETMHCGHAAGDAPCD